MSVSLFSFFVSAFFLKPASIPFQSMARLGLVVSNTVKQSSRQVSGGMSGMGSLDMQVGWCGKIGDSIGYIGL